MSIVTPEERSAAIEFTSEQNRQKTAPSASRHQQQPMSSPQDSSQPLSLSPADDEQQPEGHLQSLRFPIAERLNRIWRQREVELGHNLSHRKVLADLLDPETGEEILSPTYLNNLRSGKSTNPTVKVLGALADYFNVPVNYFLTPDEDEANFLLMRHNVERSTTLADLINLIATLTPPGQDMVRSMVRFILSRQVPPEELVALEEDEEILTDDQDAATIDPTLDPPENHSA